jgi:hypothetical protein
MCSKSDNCKCNKCKVKLFYVKGDRGDKGDKGDTGERGEKGDRGCKGDTGAKDDMGNKGDRGEKGDRGDQGSQGERGPMGPQGDDGSQGPPGPIGPKGETGNTSIFSFATSESVNNNSFIGLGNSSNNILRNTLVVPFNCTTDSLAFNIRELATNNSYNATLYINNQPTTLFATIPNGTTSYKIKTNGNIALAELDFISIKITYSNGGASSNGACVSLVVKEY